MAVNLYIGFAQPDEWVGWAGTYAKHVHRSEEAVGEHPVLSSHSTTPHPNFSLRYAPKPSL